MHLASVAFQPHTYPTAECFPFNLEAFRQAQELTFPTPVTFFVGENGTGKSTLLEALALRCGIHIWHFPEGPRVRVNPYEHTLHRHIQVTWANGSVPGSYFGSAVFQDFAALLDEWAASDPGLLQYFGGQSLMTQSHGQSILAFFRARFQRKGLYLLDEPETALSPRSQIELLRLLTNEGSAGQAQFVIATHSPILMASPGATIYSFDQVPISRIEYEATEHFCLYKRFMDNPLAHSTASAPLTDA